jgi:L-ascorbate metabolism protein UlaG (beta-lactamase superfamily)
MMIWIFLVAPLALFAVGLTAFFKLAPQVGGNPDERRRKRMQAAPNYRDGKFFNVDEIEMSMSPGRIVQLIRDSNKKGVEREPKAPLPALAFDRARWEAAGAAKTAFCWFGHSSFMLKIDGLTFLFDPVFGQRASMFSFMGPRHFDYANHPRVADLPEIDVLILTHDHYDHLDYPTIIQMKDKVSRVYTALGVGAHLEKWGYDPAKITELLWWEEADVNDRIRLACTPTRHFSGRGLTNRFSTLWSSWVIAGSRHKIFFGSDSGYHGGFQQIGEQYGPFDLTLLECGAYSRHWPDVHNTPEEAVQAHLDLKGKALMPIHWAKFNLAQHAWTEPVARLRREAQIHQVEVTTPRIGEVVLLEKPLPQAAWWEEVK